MTHPRHFRLRGLRALLCVLLAGCGSSTVLDAGIDGGIDPGSDAGIDAGINDAGINEAGVEDAGIVDAGTCRPAAGPFQTCTEDRSTFTFCADSETDQRARLCSDAGMHAYGRHSNACEGGTRLWEVISGIGPYQSCIYVDGGLAGASDLTDFNSGPVYRVWSLPNCQTTALCP